MWNWLWHVSVSVFLFTRSFHSHWATASTDELVQRKCLMSPTHSYKCTSNCYHSPRTTPPPFTLTPWRWMEGVRVWGRKECRTERGEAGGGDGHATGGGPRGTVYPLSPCERERQRGQCVWPGRVSWSPPSLSLSPAFSLTFSLSVPGAASH